MAECTFVGDNGTYTVNMPQPMEQYVAAGYFIEWCPGVYEFTERGKEWITELKRSGLVS